MDLYSINDMNNIPNLDVGDLKKSYIEYGIKASAINHNVKISNPPKKYDYSKWVKKTNKKDLQFLLAYPSVSVLPNRSKYSDLASTYVEFNLLVLKPGDIMLYLDANGFDNKSNSCLVSCDIPESELYFGNDITSYVSKVPLSERKNKLSSGFSFNLDSGLHKIRVHIDEDGFHFRSIIIDESNNDMATFVSKKYKEESNKLDKIPEPEFAQYSRNLMELSEEEDILDIIPTQEEIVNGHLQEINSKLDNIIVQNSEANDIISKSKPINKIIKNNKNNSGSRDNLVFNQYISDKKEEEKSNKKKNKKDNKRKQLIISDESEDSEIENQVIFRISDDTTEDISNSSCKKSLSMNKTYNFYILILILFILFFIFINEESSILPFVSTPTPSPEFITTTSEF